MLVPERLWDTPRCTVDEDVEVRMPARCHTDHLIGVEPAVCQDQQNLIVLGCEFECDFRVAAPEITKFIRRADVRHPAVECAAVFELLPVFLGAGFLHRRETCMEEVQREGSSSSKLQLTLGQPRAAFSRTG